MLINNLFLATGTGYQMDERTRKVLLVLCALLIVVLLIMGAIYAIIHSYMEKESTNIDGYMYNLLKAKIVKTPSQFKRAMLYYEERNLFQKSSPGWWIVIIATLIVVGLSFIVPTFGGHHLQFLTKIDSIFPTIKWQTTAQYNETLKQLLEQTGRLAEYDALKLTGPSFLPASVFPSFISKNPDFSDPALYVSIIYYIVLIVGFFIITKAILAYIARTNRGFKKSTEVFVKSLDTISLDTLGDLVANQDNNK